MPDIAIAALLALTTFCAFMLWHVARALARVETDLAALKSDLAELASWKPERLCRFDREK